MSSTETILGEAKASWWVVLFGGIISILVGIIALVWPAATVVTVAILLAIWLILSGVF